MAACFMKLIKGFQPGELVNVSHLFDNINTLSTVLCLTYWLPSNATFNYKHAELRDSVKKYQYHKLHCYAQTRTLGVAPWRRTATKRGKVEYPTTLCSPPMDAPFGVQSTPVWNSGVLLSSSCADICQMTFVLSKQ